MSERPFHLSTHWFDLQIKYFTFLENHLYSGTWEHWIIYLQRHKITWQHITSLIPVHCYEVTLKFLSLFIRLFLQANCVTNINNGHLHELLVCINVYVDLQVSSSLAAQWRCFSPGYWTNLHTSLFLNSSDSTLGANVGPTDDSSVGVVNLDNLILAGGRTLAHRSPTVAKV